MKQELSLAARIDAFDIVTYLIHGVSPDFIAPAFIIATECNGYSRR
jgi:hypothetical protein